MGAVMGSVGPAPNIGQGVSVASGGHYEPILSRAICQ